MEKLYKIICFSVLPFLGNQASLFAQVDTLFIDNPGDEIQLFAPDGNYIYSWSPEFTLDNPTIRNPIAKPFVTTTYIVKRISSVINENLIVNPDFSEGNEGFTSDYGFVERINIQGVYGINESAENLNGIFFSDCPDHTDGTGLMMIVDGSPTPNEKVWCQDIMVEPNQDYAFSSWLTSVNRENPALLQFSINSIPIGTVFQAGSIVCRWRQFYATWNSGQNTSAEICIVNRNTNPAGNDFALDDFAFYELDEILCDTVVVVVKALEEAAKRKVFFPNAFSPNGDNINDLFYPNLGNGILDIQSFKIFSRWGDLVFERSNCGADGTSCGWDGTSRGSEMPPGMYVYTATIIFADRQSESYKGAIWLLR